MPDVNVLLAANQHYIAHLGTAVVSAMLNSNCSTRLWFHILGVELQAPLEKTLMGLSGDTAHRVTTSRLTGDQLAGMTDVRGLPLATYARLFLDRHIPPEWNQLIYLDSDTVVLTDLAELASVQTAGVPVAAVEDDGAQKTRYRDGRPDSGRFNAGVMLIDVQAWAAQQVGERAAQRVRSAAHRGHPVSDQEALNAELNGLWHRLDPSWNVSTLRHLRSLRSSPLGLDDEYKIRHFTGYRKPWNSPIGCLLGGQQYFTYYARTPWAAT